MVGFPNRLSFARLPSGTKMLIIMSAAMLPLGLIALLTSLDMARSASAERRAAAQTAAALYVSQIEARINRGLDAVRLPAASIQDVPYLCSALARQAVAAPSRPPIALFDESGRKLCQSHGAAIEQVAASHPMVDHVWLDQASKTFRLTAARDDGSLLAEADVPIEDVRRDVAEDVGIRPIRLTLRQGDSEVEIFAGESQAGDGAPLVISLPVSDGRLALVAEFAPASTGARTLLLVLLPLLMWAAAAFAGWYIINRLLLSPLAQIKRSIETWEGSRGTFPLPRITTPSHEIRDLADSFASVTARIQKHETELEEGLARQTRLTREVHHRVKNNLQVVSSLINLHARGAEGDVAAAYGAIQRRVDALAVVHRNHYAELEENRGLAMRALAGELAASLRGSAPAAAAGMPIALNMVDLYVTQDVAVPAAFLITEVIELMMHCNPRGSVLISLEPAEAPGRARLRIETFGMEPGAIAAYPAIVRFERVVTGIARQFRAPLIEDRDAGRFEIEIAAQA
ncbi:sensor histidine kinase [Rhizorhabdus phycosphaerae]|uniref:sensor histidine kinase n=1 Tax=Rhizorhabdus phycosphaerae TaxID=2711156 RepID=UPI001D009E94|nr:sensor histidine kinase [Rhizorhabdus phycosphaerae]